MRDKGNMDNGNATTSVATTSAASPVKWESVKRGKGYVQTSGLCGIRGAESATQIKARLSVGFTGSKSALRKLVDAELRKGRQDSMLAVTGMVQTLSMAGYVATKVEKTDKSACIRFAMVKEEKVPTVDDTLEAAAKALGVTVEVLKALKASK